MTCCGKASQGSVLDARLPDHCTVAENRPDERVVDGTDASIASAGAFGKGEGGPAGDNEKPQ